MTASGGAATSARSPVTANVLTALWLAAPALPRATWPPSRPQGPILGTNAWRKGVVRGSNPLGSTRRPNVNEPLARARAGTI
jgi:hypothetical protein